MLPRYDRLSMRSANSQTAHAETETNLAEMIVHYLNFNNIAQNLFSENENVFERFFEKLYNIDRRALIIFIRSHKNRISEQNLRYAGNYFETRGYVPKWHVNEST